MNQEFKPADQGLTSYDEVTQTDAEQHAVTAQASGHAMPRGVPAQKPARRRVVTTGTLSSRTCRWPFGDPAKPDFHYCGELPISGRVYCSTHDNMSYNAPPRRRSS
jgi:hypothetical protein